MLQKMLVKDKNFKIKNVKQYAILHFTSCTWWLQGGVVILDVRTASFVWDVYVFVN